MQKGLLKDFKPADYEAKIWEWGTDYLKEEQAELAAAAEGWLGALSQGAEISAIEKVADDELVVETRNVINHDAERGYVDPEMRDVHRSVLRQLAKDFKDYDQGMSLVAAMLLLCLTPEETVAVCRELHTAKGFQQYWRTTAIAKSADCRLFLKAVLPSVNNKLAEQIEMVSCGNPEIMLTKYFTALGLGLLTMKQVKQFLDGVCRDGTDYIMKVLVVVCTAQEKSLMRVKDPSAAVRVLQSDDIRKIDLSQADAVELPSNWKDSREEVIAEIEEKVRKANEFIKAGADKDEGFYISDTDSDESD